MVKHGQDSSGRSLLGAFPAVGVTTTPPGVLSGAHTCSRMRTIKPTQGCQGVTGMQDRASLLLRRDSSRGHHQVHAVAVRSALCSDRVLTP